MSRRLFIKTNFDLCSGCEICQMACSLRLLGGYNPHRALLRITHTDENLYHFPKVCNQCLNPYCASVCPVQAIERDRATGAMVVDRDKCVACGLCGQYCPEHLIWIDPELDKAVKCDLCQGRPRCVESCPTGALETVWMEVRHG